MKAITVANREAGVAGMTLAEMPEPHASGNDVIVRVHASGFTPGELTWLGTWTDRAGRDRTPSIPGHELSGVVTELGYGTTGLTDVASVQVSVGNVSRHRPAPTERKRPESRPEQKAEHFSRRGCPAFACSTPCHSWLDGR
jgi:NADPH:quinone reductase-like Zn-dependent oxidoreductase